MRNSACKFTMLNQSQQVFVYEESMNLVNLEKNGTLNLLKAMP